MACAAGRIRARIAGWVLLALLGCARPAAPADPPVEVILPGVLLAEEPATLGVLNDGRPAAGVTVELDSGERIVTDANGHGHFRVSGGRMVVTARLGEVVATATVLSRSAVLAADRPQIERVPRLLTLGERATVRGRGFDGQAEANRVMLGANPAYVLAASPLALVIAPPANTPPGAAELAIESGGRRSAARPVTLVALHIEAPTNLSAGTKVRPRVIVEGTGERVPLEITNRSPDILRLAGGGQFRVVSTGGESNFAELKAKALRAGPFSIMARLVAPATGEPDSEYARLLLDRARQLTENDKIRERIAWMLVQLDRRPLPASAVMREINRVLGSFPLTVPLGKTLEAARDALEGR